MIFGLFALVFASLFTGGAFYISLVEQPARLALEVELCWPNGSRATSADSTYKGHWRHSLLW
jgi:hypothetical protein